MSTCIKCNREKAITFKCYYCFRDLLCSDCFDLTEAWNSGGRQELHLEHLNDHSTIDLS